MNSQKHIFVTLGAVLSVSLISCAVSLLLVSRHYNHQTFDLLNVICGEILEQEPETRKSLPPP